MKQDPWVSFCISTFKRPVLLEKQLNCLLQQTMGNFEIVISDNDPDASAREVIEKINDERIKYFHNGENLGMIRSFNKSIERATTEYIVMVTDDDPVLPSFLEEFSKIIAAHPGYSIYAGFFRPFHKENELEIIQKEDFISEVLDPKKTSKILWSSSIMKRADVLETGKIPDYGSPHLADHALIAIVGHKRGGVLVNNMYSSLTSHDSNFSKFNYSSYVDGCIGFYETMVAYLKEQEFRYNRKVVLKHLGSWFITNTFSLKRYFTFQQPDAAILMQIDDFARQILAFPFMKGFKNRYHIKNTIFKVKKLFG